MGKRGKLLRRILSGQSDYNISFNELANLLLSLGFKMRQEGSHRIFTKDGIVERINLQSEGSKAKGYQVRQIRKILTTYKFDIGKNDE
ncbi:MAG: type II toxin-antitoxin system HicA family toxin [Candidatus Brocadiaceae bacterium]|nr:type II toxin-antitoxin system HicA family toxin [Candidatus Brocadiaceae bacterium]